MAENRMLRNLAQLTGLRAVAVRCLPSTDTRLIKFEDKFRPLIEAARRQMREWHPDQTSQQVEDVLSTGLSLVKQEADQRVDEQSCDSPQVRAMLQGFELHADTDDMNLEEVMAR
ncbi:hypothetical protein [Nitrospirillum pindoramense]|uniref:Uncharacterized protein n=1 Tax=Nitrospirillum amazonense TaxID=28077 RepID=A0A560H633_9PROT|nr:hypothetical protein [Nitrospirillum amazonense]TWB41738.1 hypothetical protein FBZ90_107109 [Nitrospirillum amazonense]